MSWKQFGFATRSTGSGGGSIQANKKPTTDDGIIWNIPTLIPIVRGSLVVIYNGLIQYAEEDFRELENGTGFEWISPFPIPSEDWSNLRCMYTI